KTDFTVPFDLTPYKGKNVVLDIVTPQGRSSVREASGDVCWKGITLADSFDSSDRETRYRPLFHHSPLYGWMNDPNGMFFKNGKWHLYYQRNPYGSKWQNMTWGHSVSSDLINWEHLPDAIRPDGLGSIFSGSCVIDHDNTAGYGKDAVIALYTSAGTSQMQSMAASTDDGLTFEVYGANPVLTLESEARDPNMFWNEKTGEWNLTLAHALDHEMLFFTSPDLKTWTLQSAFGKGIGAQGGVWECPDLFELPVEGTGESKWVLLCNLNPGGPFGGSATQYFIGDWDGKTFTADTDAMGEIPTKWLDYGKDHYATVSWSDAPQGRRTVIGWMSNWEYAADVPTLQFRSANTLPREIGLFKGADGQVYAASVPSPELEAMRGRVAVNRRNASVGSKPVQFALPAENSGICEILLDLDAQKAAKVDITLSNKEGDKVVMVYDAAAHTLSFDRTKSGVVDFSDAFPAVTVAPTFETDGKVQLRLYIDRSSIELFGNGGRFAMTNLVFPTAPYDSMSVSSTGGKAKISDIKIYSLNPAK
ncbi:MAG: GH32 C-terminal domain-containing protein, partial [Muribaculaceae bacterium]|nr:GH32 C-terminal domain-containing protein [Muribaculaceae bacterium]